MPITNFPNGVSSYGIPLPAAPSQVGVPGGSVFFVNSSNTAANSGGGYSKDVPALTIAQALALCVASRGDVIYVLPGHAETIIAAGGITVSVAGVSIIGSGLGTLQPTITFTTSTAATFLVSAANVLIQGLKFVCSIASQVTMIAVTAKQVTVDSCLFGEGTATGLSAIAITGSANAADNLTISNNTFYFPTAGNMNHAIGLSEVEDNVQVSSNNIQGNFALSAIHNITGKVLTRLKVFGNFVQNLTAAKRAMQLISACTGESSGNYFNIADATIEPVAYGTALRASGDTSTGGDLDSGDMCMFAKTGLVSSAITTAGVDISGASTGALRLEAYTLQTNSTGLAAMTNFTIVINNTSGNLTPISQAITGLGANATVTAGATAELKFVLESGAKMTAKATGTNGTGAGTIDVYLVFRRVTPGAHVSPV